ncbi:MAG: hypothetical protein IJD97_07810 [Clostridia bacterium]|nr:hypothetical protein [Clostridia bacterium]
MKKFVCILLTLILTLQMVGIMAAGETVLKVEAISAELSEKEVISGSGSWMPAGGYICFKNVDLTGVKSLHMNAFWGGGRNGDAFMVRADNPKTGEVLGVITVGDDKKTTFSAPVDKEISGAHDLYIYSCYGLDEYENYKVYIKSLTLSKEEYKRAETRFVSDDKIVDNFSDTWVATDALGRAVAGYEEAGEVKEGEREIGMLYWTWHTAYDIADAFIIENVIKAHPEAKDDYYNKAWALGNRASVLYWDEPIFGFYGSADYWVYRRQAEMLANAGVDALFFDWSNADYIFLKQTKVMADAFRDAKEAGVDIPRISGYTSNYWDWAIKQAKAYYLNFFVEDDYSDIWYYRDGKPLIFGEIENAIDSATCSTEDKYLMAKVKEHFSNRDHANEWEWLEDYPQKARGERDGRVEFITAGIARNHSYVGSGTWCFSDPYAKGRGYTEGFGEDYRPIAKNEGYFFKEQISRALSMDPTFIMIDGWNEFKTNRQNNYEGKWANGFVDLYDSENSRDIEPVKGVLRDDYYNLLCDFVRKYKGVRKVDTASAEITIDINGDASAWASVSPEYRNDKIDYKRNSLDQHGNDYTNTVENSIIKSKVARDAANYYFYAETLEDIKINEGKSFHLYINTDRNRATGWEGYDYALNLNAMGAVSANAGGYNWNEVGKATYTVKGNILQIALPKSLIGGDYAQFEFKWADAAEENGDILRFYEHGVVAPAGRFNYLYTTFDLKTMTASERAALSGTTVIKAGSAKMAVSGAVMNVYEPDTRICAKDVNGTIYLPMTAVEEILGYGVSKVYMDAEEKMVLLKNHGLENETIVNDMLVYARVGENFAHVNGKYTNLSNTIIDDNGYILIPVSLLTECFGFKTVTLSNGAVALSRADINTAVAEAAATYLN